MTSTLLKLGIGILVAGGHRARKVASAIDDPSQGTETQLPLQSSQWIVTVADGCSEYPTFDSIDSAVLFLVAKLLHSFFYPQSALRVAGLLKNLCQLQVGPGAKGGCGLQFKPAEALVNADSALRKNTAIGKPVEKKLPGLRPERRRKIGSFARRDVV